MLGKCWEGIDCGTLPDWIMAIIAIVGVYFAYQELKKLRKAEDEAAEAQKTQAQQATAAAVSAEEQAAQTKILADAATAQAAHAKAAADAAKAQADLVKAETKAAENRTEIARATLLLEIDRDFESEYMQESRRQIRSVYNRLEQYAKDKYNDTHTPEDISQKAKDYFSEYMNWLWRDFKTSDEAERDLESPIAKMVDEDLKKGMDPGDLFKPADKAGPQYQRLTRLLGWLERVGYMANQNLLLKQDVIRLYDFLFVDGVGRFEQHIRKRQKDELSPNPDYMQQALIFRDYIVEEREKQAKPAAPEDKPSPLFAQDKTGEKR